MKVYTNAIQIAEVCKNNQRSHFTRLGRLYKKNNKNVMKLNCCFIISSQCYVYRKTSSCLIFNKSTIYLDIQILCT